MKVVIFGNGAIGKTLRAIEDFGVDTISVDSDPRTMPNMVGDINDDAFKSGILSEGDILVDLTAGNDAVPASKWCFRNGVCYLNSDMSSPTMFTNVERRFEQLRGMFRRMNETPGSTILYCQGMNPGMVSHYFSEVVFSNGIERSDIEEIHVSEIDTQISDVMPKRGLLISTWCVAGNFTDTLDASSLHDKRYWRSRLGRIRRAARDNLYWTRNPWDGRFETYLSGNHEEVYEIGKSCGAPACFSYKSPVQFNEASKHMSREDKFDSHIMSEDTMCGYNAVGIYLRTKGGREYWCGSRLGIAEARSMVRNRVEKPVLNATTVLTASGVYAGVKYLMENPRRGWIMPLEADSSFMIRAAKKFLGDYFCGEMSGPSLDK
jgi:homospermidine synthase